MSVWCIGYTHYLPNFHCGGDLAIFFATLCRSPPGFCFIRLLVPNDRPFCLASVASDLVLTTCSQVRRLCQGLSYVLNTSLTHVCSHSSLIVSYLWADLLVCYERAALCRLCNHLSSLAPSGSLVHCQFLCDLGLSFCRNSY